MIKNIDVLCLLTYLVHLKLDYKYRCFAQCYQLNLIDFMNTLASFVTPFIAEMHR